MATFGETLKRERELRKITLREVSEATKIGLRYLEALEGNRFDQLPGGLFNKGFIRAYARFIGLDPEALVNAYLFEQASLRNPQPERAPYAGIRIEEIPPALEEAEPAGPARPSGRRGLVALAVAGGIVLVSGLALIQFRARGPRTDPALRPGSGELASMMSFPDIRQEPDAPPGLRSQDAPPMETRVVEPPDTIVPEEAEPPAQAAVETLPVPPPALPEDSASPAPVPETGVSITLSTRWTTRVVLDCLADGRHVELAAGPGETISMSCGGEIRLSADDAGALIVQINRRDCRVLGRPGQSLWNYRIDVERAARICPAPETEP
jgi:cytoskeleton protein RodZ